MLRDLLLLRLTFPAGFRGVRLLAVLMFWGTVTVLAIGFVAELASTPADHDKHGHDKRLQRNIR